jgi:hypothetical protein
MDIEYEDESLRQLASDPKFDAGFGRDVVKAFRKEDSGHIRSSR